jgi:hypothetical protein
MATESEQLVELLFGAKDSYRTARATIREWRDERTRGARALQQDRVVP